MAGLIRHVRDQARPGTDAATAGVGEWTHHLKALGEGLPRLVFEAFMALLRDPYRRVHKFAVHALRRTHLPEEFKPRAKTGLLLRLAGYMGDRQDDHFFVECLDFYLARYAAPEDRAGKFGSWAIARIEAVEALLAAVDRRVDNSGHLRHLAIALDDATTRYGDVRVAVAYSAFASLMRTLAMLVEWRAAVQGAAIDADRLQRSARVLHRGGSTNTGKARLPERL